MLLHALKWLAPERYDLDPILCFCRCSYMNFFYAIGCHHSKHLEYSSLLAVSACLDTWKFCCNDEKSGWLRACPWNGCGLWDLNPVAVSWAATLLFGYKLWFTGMVLSCWEFHPTVPCVTCSERSKRNQSLGNWKKCIDGKNMSWTLLSYLCWGDKTP
jgi:hypothetical protein